MADDMQRLVVSLEARVNQFDKALAKANGTANRRARAIESRFQIMNNKVSAQLTGIGRSFVGAFAGGIFAGGAAGLVRTVRGVASELSEMGKQMDRVGLSAKVFQELQFGFGLAGVATNEFNVGMEQFTKRIAEAEAKGGTLADILEANGLAIRDANGEIKSSDILLRQYADLVKNAASEQERMLLATEAFGRGGASFVNALKDGAAGFDEMALRAAEAGGTIDEELIRKAEELDDKFEIAFRNFEINAKKAILNVVPILETLDDAARNILQNLPVVRLHEMITGGEEAVADVAAVTNEIDVLERRVKTLQDAIERNVELGISTAEVDAALNAVQARLASLRGELANLNAEAQRSYVVGTPGDPNAIAQATPGKSPPKRTVIPASNDGSGGGRKGGGRKGSSRGGGGGGGRLDELQRAIELMRERTTALAAMTAAQAGINPLIDDYGFAVERASAVVELENAAKKAGLEITPELATQINTLATAYADASSQAEQLAKSQDKARESAEGMRDLGKSAMSGFIQDLQAGKSASEALANALQKVADKLLEVALNTPFGGTILELRRAA
ncbi:hypothetical protein [Chelativorans alearense]|uniref:hypothetical protein n=1 Tax=Chelativorans alearense TaxID=2681495 RepID=UPI0013D800FA|nr:hypothetical protein [Chelativorans alearense]